MQKRTRRKASEIERLRGKILKVVRKEGNISLTDLVRQYGASIGIRNTPSDKNLAKRQLDILAKNDHINFKRNGRDLVARYLGDPLDATPVAALAAPPPTAAEPESATDTGRGGAPPMELDVVTAYARQVEEFAKTLQKQISTLVRMVERASG